MHAIGSASNYGFYNRQIITNRVRESFNEDEMHLIYDVAHNIAKIEKYLIDGANWGLVGVTLRIGGGTGSGSLTDEILCWINGLCSMSPVEDVPP